MQADHATRFNEAEWLKLVFLLADTQQWLDELSKGAMGQLPLEGKRKFLQKSYYLSVGALAHILERHYYKVPRYPAAGKFHVPVTEVLSLIRAAFVVEPVAIKGKLSLVRIMDTGKMIGFDRYGG